MLNVWICRFCWLSRPTRMRLRRGKRTPVKTDSFLTYSILEDRWDPAGWSCEPRWCDVLPARPLSTHAAFYTPLKYTQIKLYIRLFIEGPDMSKSNKSRLCNSWTCYRRRSTARTHVNKKALQHLEAVCQITASVSLQHQSSHNWEKRVGND